MTETPIMVDSKIKFVVPGNVLKAVIVPGKLVNLLTKPTDKEKCITVTEGVRNGKPFRRIKYGSKVPKKFRMN